MKNKDKILKEYGLRDNEIKVYLASLSLGTSRVNEIYDILPAVNCGVSL